MPVGFPEIDSAIGVLEDFSGEGGALLLAGNALHADLSPDSAGSGLFGWFMCALGQAVGFPVPEGGAGMLTAALVRRLETQGGQVAVNRAVDRVIVHRGRAVVRISDGEEILARRAILADVTATALYSTLLTDVALPCPVEDDLTRFRWNAGTVKIDWALARPVPWSAPEARLAGTVHIADSPNELIRWTGDLATRTVPARPFLIFGRQSITDPTRQPPGTETAWAYTHVPRRIDGDAAGEISGRWDSDDEADMAERIEQRVEANAPGFRAAIIGRHIFTPHSMEGADANLDGGAINGGTSQLHQQVIFRTPPGFGRPSTYVAVLLLASSSAHPGGGVQGVRLERGPSRLG